MSEDEAVDLAEPSERIVEADRTLFLIPGIAHPVTPNEIHAVVLGATLGVLLGWAHANGFTTTAMIGSAVLVGYAVVGRPFMQGLPHDAEEYPDTIALRTIQYEPWWFLAAFVPVFGVIVHAV